MTNTKDLLFFVILAALTLAVVLSFIETPIVHAMVIGEKTSTKPLPVAPFTTSTPQTIGSLSKPNPFSSDFFENGPFEYKFTRAGRAESLKNAAEHYSETSWYHSALVRVSGVQEKYGDVIRKAARKNDIDPKLVTAVIMVESTGNPNEQSSTGAAGLMQLTDIATAEVPVHGNVWDPETNIKMGTAYLAQLRYRYGYHTKEAIAVAYNVGPTATRSMTQSQVERHDYAQKVSFMLKHL